MITEKSCLLLSDMSTLCSKIKNCNLDLKNKDLIILSVICAEDRKYFTHHGFSFFSILRASYTRHGGASTITMQLVRTLTGRYEVSISRKIREIFLSTIINYKYTKIEILRAYLYYSYYGSNLKGLDDVIAKLFPSKKTEELSFYDCCFIASLIKRPYPLEISISWAMKINNRINYIYRVYSTMEKKYKKQMIRYL